MMIIANNGEIVGYGGIISASMKLPLILTRGVMPKNFWFGVETGTPFSHQIKRKTAPNSSNKVSIRLREFPHWIFLFHCNAAVTCHLFISAAPGATRRNWNEKSKSSSNVTSAKRSHAFPPHYTLDSKPALFCMKLIFVALCWVISDYTDLRKKWQSRKSCRTKNLW